jgi:biopolymer transport protein ExbD
MSASASSANRAEPNLTPILDMVFQLITFFMLVINFQGAALDQSLKLPVLGSAKPAGAEESLLVLNIDKGGQLKVYGVPQDVKKYIAHEARMEELKMSAQDKNYKKGDELPTTVVIRADKSTPFKLLNDVVKVCQEHGYRKFSLKAMTKAEGA